MTTLPRSRRKKRTWEQYEVIIKCVSRKLDPQAVHLIRRGSKTTPDDFEELGVPRKKGNAIRKLQLEVRANGIFHGFAAV